MRFPITTDLVSRGPFLYGRESTNPGLTEDRTSPSGPRGFESTTPTVVVGGREDRDKNCALGRYSIVPRGGRLECLGGTSSVPGSPSVPGLDGERPPKEVESQKEICRPLSVPFPISKGSYPTLHSGLSLALPTSLPSSPPPVSDLDAVTRGGTDDQYGGVQLLL